MLKWKHGCHSLKKWLKSSLVDENGITLVELLASIALLSIVILLAGAVHMFGQKQYMSQSQSAGQSNDLAYSLSVMSRELRGLDSSSVRVSDSGDAIMINEEILFSKEGSRVLTSDGSCLVDGVEEFVAEIEDGGIEISLTSEAKNNRQSKVYRTTIYFRR